VAWAKCRPLSSRHARRRQYETRTRAFPPAPGCGVVFKLSGTEKETALYSFTGGADGGEPSATLVQDEDGKLYGATAGGGASEVGVVFKLDRGGGRWTACRTSAPR
jgi:uncharacterized repeat protein (TIGR03803 family)